MSPPRKLSAVTGSAHGQALVEFTLVMPILMVLLLTVADFGRFFAAAITIESAAGAASEVAAADYMNDPLSMPPPGTLTAGSYARIHTTAWQAVCHEASGLPNAVPGTGAGECDGLATVVCIHDGADPDCSSSYNDGSGIPAGCPSLQPGSRPTNSQTGGSETSRYVEVRVCYRFSTILQMSIPSIGGSLTTLGGDFYIERSRTFTVVDY